MRHLPIQSDYFKAINSLKPKTAPKTIRFYVENEDDTPFWIGIFERYAPHLRFKRSLPSQNLVRGKYSLLKNTQPGEYLLLCVDSDYDYLLQDTTETSKLINHNPYIFQTYTYSYDNYKCYADSLRNVCVSASLNDEEFFDFVAFLKLYSNIIYKLFLYSYHFEKQADHSFTITDFGDAIKILKNVDINEQGKTAIEALRNSVKNSLISLKNQNPTIDIASIAKKLETLGVHEDNTYLFVKGHILYDNVVLMFLKPLDSLLKKRTFQEFSASTANKTIRNEKRKQYQAQTTDIEDALRFNTNYYSCCLMKKIEADIKSYLANFSK
ncbi:ABC transporter ATP-binding protein [Beggiatoa sp. PS]|nr:ABC transporter ATP-binding protein [Beggiatoa sp. PS]